MSHEWPPAATDDTVWREFVPARSRTPVKARQVRLWGRDVWIDEEHRVWCPACVGFVTVVELSRIGNGCPVGLQRQSGAFDPGDDGPAPQRQPAFRDLMRQPW